MDRWAHVRGADVPAAIFAVCVRIKIRRMFPSCSFPREPSRHRKLGVRMSNETKRLYRCSLKSDPDSTYPLGRAGQFHCSDPINFVVASGDMADDVNAFPRRNHPAWDFCSECVR